MLKLLFWAALLGFAVTLFWALVVMLLFNLRDPFWTRVLWVVIYGTCPAWLIVPTGTDVSIIITPIANAGVYSMVAYAIIKFRRRFGLVKPR